jgi:ribonuclease HII
LLRFERALWAAGVVHVAGVDEAGVGPLAGPVVAAAVIMPPETFIAGVDDSKKLSAAARERLAPLIRQASLAWAVGAVEPGDIDQLNVYQDCSRCGARSRPWARGPSMSWSMDV